MARDADIFLIYVDALTAADRWKELLALMQSPRKPPVTASTAHLILAQCHAKLHPDLIEARRELAGVLNVGGKPELPVLARAASIAETLHMYDLAVQGLKIMAQARPSKRIQMLEKIYELQQGQRNVEGMFEAIRQLREMRPDNPTYLARLNYLRLVNGLELEPAYEGVLGSQAPAPADAATEVPTPLLRALAALRFGDLDLMKREVAALPDPENYPPATVPSSPVSTPSAAAMSKASASRRRSPPVCSSTARSGFCGGVCGRGCLGQTAAEARLPHPVQRTATTCVSPIVSRGDAQHFGLRNEVPLSSEPRDFSNPSPAGANPS